MAGFSLVARIVVRLISNNEERATKSDFKDESKLSSRPAAHLILTKIGKNRFNYKEKVNALHEN
jgi:hypothetical protein